LGDRVKSTRYRSTVSTSPMEAKQTLVTSTETDIEPVLDRKLDKLLDVKLDNFEERLGKLSA
jgi:hypothetical protein